MAIRPFKEFASKGFAEIKKIQTGEKLLPKTGFDFIDDHLGCMLPGDVALLSSPSGTGKTTIAQKIKKNLLNIELNPDAANYVYVDYSLEMKVFNLLMRASAEILKKKKSEILFNEFTEEEQTKIRAYYETLQDDRQFLDQVPPTPEEFYNDAREFCIKHKDKSAIFFSFDHVLLAKGSDKKRMLEEFAEKINQLKLEFDNVYFILISQNNRQIYSRIAEKSNLAAPNPTDVFGSSFLDQLCSFNIVFYAPFKAGIKEYMKVNPTRYQHLSEYFGEEDNKGRVSFHTEGLIFAHAIKTRESDNMYKDIFVIDMELSSEEKENLKEKVEVKSSSMPEFNEDMPKKEFVFPTLEEAFENDDKEDDPPF
ncbi:MAG: hypothetical protein ACJAVA_000216 [Flavobacteriaceae bacterium]|jgi:hypothetical protein